jgi:hypothetical protein
VLDTAAVPPASIPGYADMVTAIQPLSIPTVPEPATLVLLCVGVLALVLGRRRLHRTA